MYNLTIINDRIMSLAENRGLSKSKLLQNAHLNKSVFDNLSKGRIPGVDKIHALADYLECSVDYLLGRTDRLEINCGPSADLSGVELEMLQRFQKISHDQQQREIGRLELLAEQAEDAERAARNEVGAAM